MRHRPKTVMLFCAGRGTRMGALTEVRPKPMISVGGRPLVDHALDIVDGVPNKIANTHYLPQTLNAHLARRGVDVIEETDLLETGGGLKNAAHLIREPACFTLNTDAVWIGGSAVETLSNAWDPDRMDALLLTVPMAQTRGHTGTGDFDMTQDGRLERGNALVYTGLQIIKPASVCAVDDDAFSMNVVWNQIARTNRLFGAVFDGVWCDVGHPEGIHIAEAAMREAENV